MFDKLKHLALNGKIPTKLAKVWPPRCAGCLFGAMTKVPWWTKQQQDESHAVFAATKPGECVSVNHMQSTEPGFYGQAKGALTKTLYRNATIFVDHYSRLKFVYLMMSNLTSAKTINTKHAFERFAAEHGVRIQHYHCNNGRFADSMFHESCKAKGQQLTFCGVNAHFQNSIAKQAICNLSESAWKQLLHACQRWPQAMSTALWPYALCHTAHLNNVLLMLPNCQSRLELFSSINVGSNMHFLHTFGCPVFALDNPLTSNKAVPQWDPRARLGLNLGPSPTHARNVHLVLSLTTDLVSPQFHLRFDDFFETCKYGVTDAGLASTWQRLAGFTHGSLNEPVLHASNGLLGQSTILHQSVRAIPRGSAERDSFPPKEISDTGTITSQFYEDGSVIFSDMPLPVTGETLHVTPQGSHVPFHVTCPASQPPVQPSAQRNCTRTPRNAQRAVPRDTPADFLVSPHAGISTRGQNCTISRTMADSVAQRSFFGPSGVHYMSASATAGNTYDGRTFGDNDSQTFKDLLHDEHLALQDCMSRPIAFHAEMMGDIMYLNQALNQPDASHFVEAVIAEVNGHVDNKHWQLTKRSKVPPDVDVLPSVWSIRQKRDITTNEVKKYKAHLNLHGGKQEYRMNYYETYAPVVTWFSIRLMMVIGILHVWALCQCDFIMAYPQAPIECNM